ncbi:hypothetical protein KUCAC02_031036 [Chaenocephalus aceratus]|uniref:Uncharacterized protein n=1 Tax=Chaenocephalus aceratus TaxID=36190 RepID=A0ACB9XMU1_CHAAC|nr:hypothetical protein KUCAC02_031036 [Chaenocephalus aceratus]
MATILTAFSQQRVPQAQRRRETSPPCTCANSHSYPHFHHHTHRHPGPEHTDSCQSGELTYETFNGLRSGRKQRLESRSACRSLWVEQAAAAPGTVTPTPSCTHMPLAPSSLPPQGYPCERGMGGGHRRTAMLNYENLPSLPPVWEYRALQRDDEQEEEDDEQDEEEYEEEEEDLMTPTTKKMWPTGTPAQVNATQLLTSKKNAAMSNLQKALPRDDGTSRKNRTNSTDLPL